MDFIFKILITFNTGQYYSLSASPMIALRPSMPRVVKKVVRKTVPNVYVVF